MTWILIQSLILGVVEGLTEFIPVSSTGHLIIASDLLGFTGETSAAFTVFIQLGAILAVVWETRKKLIGFAADLGWGGSGLKMGVNLALALAPSAVIGLAIHDFIEETLFSPVYVAWGLIAGGIGILLIERARPAGRVSALEQVPWRSALAVGFSQVLSLFPGVSRSAATIMGGMVAGMDRRTSTEFSFLLAIPTMFGASLLDLWKWRDVLSAADVPTFGLGFLTAFLSGLVAVRFLLRYVSRHDFRPFAWYRFAVAAAVLWMVWGG